jgi:hypothetical protein
MSKMYTVTGFDYIELTDQAKVNVRQWLDQDPIELEDGCTYIGDWDDEYIQDHCQINGYVFDRNGKPIHNIIERL